MPHSERLRNRNFPLARWRPRQRCSCACGAGSDSARGDCARGWRRRPSGPQIRPQRSGAAGALRRKGHSSSQTQRVPAMPKKLRSGLLGCLELVGP
ncbi:hypothetical protein H8959_006301 [Pygathrix nigripes]